VIVADVSMHLDTFTLPEPEAPVFTSPHGKLLRHANFRRGVWYPALSATGLDVHLHDLCHTGNQLIADAGANLRELMERMATPTAARHSSTCIRPATGNVSSLRLWLSGCNPNSASRTRHKRTVWHVYGTTARAPMARRHEAYAELSRWRVSSQVSDLRPGSFA
jgi:hypothetical protein